MKGKSSAPTMKDVAREAGVALGTVSKVMNGLPVGESYRLRVKEAAEKLGYQVNNYARGLRASKTYVVALILPSTSHPFFGLLAEHIDKELSRRGYQTILSLTGYDIAAEQECIRMVQQNKVDGIIALTYTSDLQISAGVPFVSIDRYLGPNVPCITSDNFGGGQMAAAKLAELGCKNLLFLRIGSEVTGEADKRGLGFEAYCKMNNISYTSLLRNDADGYESFPPFFREHITDGKFDFDGIFCCTDHLAVIARDILSGMGIRVPEDVQIIGFDGLHYFGDGGFLCSTIVQPVEKLAKAAVSVLLSEDRSTLPALMHLPVTYEPGGTTRE